jgi:hypothetical protein
MMFCTVDIVKRLPLQHGHTVVVVLAEALLLSGITFTGFFRAGSYDMKSHNIQSTYPKLQSSILKPFPQCFRKQLYVMHCQFK